MQVRRLDPSWRRAVWKLLLAPALFAAASCANTSAPSSAASSLPMPPPVVAKTAEPSRSASTVRSDSQTLATSAARPSAPGFKGKDCIMVSPVLSAELRRQARPGTLRARAYFVRGEVTKVTILSGPRVYREPVVAGMKQYTCKGNLTFTADQTFVFTFPPTPKLPGSSAE